MSCFNAKSVHFVNVKATLTELRRNTTEVVRPAINGGKEVILTEHGAPCCKVVPLAKPEDRKAVMELLRQIGPLDLPARK